MLFRINQLIYFRMIFTIIVFLLSVETSFVEKKKITYNNITSIIFNQQINIQNIKQKKFEFRFVSCRICFNDLFVSMTFNEFVTMINKFASMKFLMSRLKRFQKAHAFDFLYFCNQHQKVNLLHTAIRKQMTSNDEKQQSMWIYYAINSVCFFRNRLFDRQCNQYFVNRFFVSEFAINQNASINKNSKNLNSKSLKQYTFAKSISSCCFCFYFVRKVDRFIILICKYFSRRSKSKFSTRFSFSQFSHIFFVFVFAFIFSRLSYLFWIVLFLF